MAIRADSINGLSLCTGIGGLELGLKIALGDGYRTICYCERESFAASVLVARMEDQTLDQAPIWDDVASFHAVPWRGAVDIITAGYPCQPFSVAGQGRGIEDDRHIWPHIARIIGEVEPAYVFIENVPNHINTGFNVVAGDLEAMGFQVAAGLYTARTLGASHTRERFYVLAYSGQSSGRRNPVTLDRGIGRDSGRFAPGKMEAADQLNGRNAFVVNTENIGYAGRRHSWDRGNGSPDADQTMVQSSTSGLSQPEWNRVAGQAERWNQEPTAAKQSVSLYPPTPDERDRDIWRQIILDRPDLDPAVESPIRGMANGLSAGMDQSDDGYRTDRIRALGNSVVPQCAAYAFIDLIGRLG